jgi:hypothetical protein
MNMKETVMTLPVDYATDAIVAEMHKSFGPPPVAHGEDQAMFDRLLREAVEALQPSDFVHRYLVRRFVNEIWEDLRSDRVRTAALNAAIRHRIEFRRQNSADTLSPSDIVDDSDIEQEAQSWAFMQCLDFLRQTDQMRTAALYRKGTLLTLIARYSARYSEREVVGLTSCSPERSAALAELLPSIAPPSVASGDSLEPT